MAILMIPWVMLSFHVEAPPLLLSKLLNISMTPDRAFIASRYRTTYSFGTSESVIAFPKVEESDFTYSFEGYDSDYNELEFTFDVAVNE